MNRIENEQYRGFMVEIKSKVHQSLTIVLQSGQNVEILGKGTADVSEADLASPHLKNFLSKGMIIISSREGKGRKDEKKPIQSKQTRPKSQVTGTSEIETQETKEVSAEQESSESQETLSREEQQESELTEPEHEETDKPKHTKYGYKEKRR